MSWIWIVLLWMIIGNNNCCCQNSEPEPAPMPQNQGYNGCGCGGYNGSMNQMNQTRFNGFGDEGRCNTCGCSEESE